MTDYITDDRGNRASISYWGSEEAARASLAALTDCTDCRNCRNCTDCTGCTDCTDCTGCTDCVSPVVVGPFRSDGYQIVMGAGRSIHAGCRVFISLAEAREHWSKPRDDGKPQSINTESLLILDFLQKIA